MRKLFSILSLVLLLCTISFGQAAVDIPLVVTETTFTQAMSVGLDLAATNCIDLPLGETEAPPPPPPGAFHIVFDLAPYGCPALTTWKDYRNAPSFPFTGNIQQTLSWQRSAPSTAINIQYTLPTGAAMVIQDQIGGIVLNLGPFTGTGTAVIPTTYPFSAALCIMQYTNIGPVGPSPIFGIAPPNLNFGNVAVGSSAMLQSTVSNTGTANLVISNISSTNAQFTFTPNAFPITILPGGNQIFDVTFSPTSGGLKTGNLVFTHNAAGSPSNYSVQGTGVQTLSASVSNVNLGNVATNSTTNVPITVSNNGGTPLTVSALITELPYWDISPPSAVIPGGGNALFTLTFDAPATPGSYPGSLEFSAPATPPVTIPLSANVVSVAGLIFEEDTVYRLEDDSYMDVMQLKSLTATVQAFQFRLLVNEVLDDETILTFMNIQKGADIAGANWVLDYNVFRGPIQANGASQDEIYVLVYDLNQNGGLPAGDYDDLLHVNYRVADLPALTDSIKSSFRITNAEASTFEGFPVDITPSRSDLVVIAKNRVGSLGDVNGDGCVDILDLIMVVDHIIGVDSLDASEFERADIAPWAPGSPEPTPDGFVNVQDLSLIQNIILTGFFPNGVPVGPCTYAILPKLSGEADAKVTLYINKDGVTAYLDSKVGIRGAQIEFANVVASLDNMIINTELGQGFFYKADNVLRTVLYDRLGEKFIEAGEHFMADMPFVLTNPSDVSLEKMILVDMNKEILMKIQVEIIYGNPPSVPYDYILYQNYPNPFNPSTAVRFQVPQTSDVTISIYDMLGQEVRTLFAGEVLRGTYTVNWDGMNNSGVKMSSGSYVYRMIAGEFVQSKKMVLVK